MMRMIEITTRAAIVAALLSATTTLAAQQSPSAPDRPVAAPGVGGTVGTGPNGATLRCRDGSYPAAGAPDSACAGKGGVLARFPLRRAARTQPATAVPQAQHPAARAGAAARDTVRPAAAVAAPAPSAAARAQAARRPDGATLLCGDGSYVVRDTASVRCASKGGVKLRFVTGRDP